MAARGIRYCSIDATEVGSRSPNAALPGPVRIQSSNDSIMSATR